MRVFAADVILRKTPLEKARAKAAKIARLFHEEGLRNLVLEDLIEDVENARFCIEAEDRGEVTA